MDYHSQLREAMGQLLNKMLSEIQAVQLTATERLAAIGAINLLRMLLTNPAYTLQVERLIETVRKFANDDEYADAAFASIRAKAREFISTLPGTDTTKLQ